MAQDQNALVTKVIAMSDNRACWHCGGYLIWDSDAPGEELGYHLACMVSFLHCQACDAQVQYLVKIK